MAKATVLPTLGHDHTGELTMVGAPSGHGLFPGSVTDFPLNNDYVKPQRAVVSAALLRAPRLMRLVRESNHLSPALPRAATEQPGRCAPRSAAVL